MDTNVNEGDGRMRFIEAGMRLLEISGPSEIKARSVAREAGTTTMGLYTHFRGIPELLEAMVEEGFSQQSQVFAGVPIGEDQMANLYALALACRAFAGNAPHLYDLMYGLSIHGRYDNARGNRSPTSRSRSSGFDTVFGYVAAQCEQLLQVEKLNEADPILVAYQFWSALHGFSMLDLAGHFQGTSDPVGDILLPMCINLVVGMGAERNKATRSARNANF